MSADKKYMQTDAAGRLPAQVQDEQTGGFSVMQGRNGAPFVLLQGVNVADGSPVRGVSYELDQDNLPVLRVVDAAPFGYDAGHDALRVAPKRDMRVEEFSVRPLNVPANQDRTITITPPEGELWSVKTLGVLFRAPAGATQGYHTFTARYRWPEANELWIFRGSAPHGTDISMRANQFMNEMNVVYPAGEEAFHRAVQSIVITPSCPLQLTYENRTDSTNETNAIIWLAVQVDAI